ncbi:uncharacterized protein L201_000071 [Kwoniella dendrophila CBS 6074]|uniref:Uncharacterized protein n=1 Tax=Kwoniella dendrophila CBS 6074 TaxID=1295534 RepID=A0AAX4JK84_9TREE
MSFPKDDTWTFDGSSNMFVHKKRLLSDDEPTSILNSRQAFVDMFRLTRRTNDTGKYPTSYLVNEFTFKSANPEWINLDGNSSPINEITRLYEILDDNRYHISSCTSKSCIGSANLNTVEHVDEAFHRDESGNCNIEKPSNPPTVKNDGSSLIDLMGKIERTPNTRFENPFYPENGNDFSIVPSKIQFSLLHIRPDLNIDKSEIIPSRLNSNGNKISFNILCRADLSFPFERRHQGNDDVEEDLDSIPDHLYYTPIYTESRNAESLKSRSVVAVDPGTRLKMLAAKELGKLPRSRGLASMIINEGKNPNSKLVSMSIMTKQGQPVTSEHHQEMKDDLDNEIDSFLEDLTGRDRSYLEERRRTTNEGEKKDRISSANRLSRSNARRRNDGARQSIFKEEL